MFLYVNGRFVEKTPIHRQIANFYATSSLSNASQGHLVDLFHFVSWNKRNKPGRDGAMPMRCMSNVNTMNLLQTFAYFFVMGGRGPISIANAAAGNLRPLFVLNLVCLLIGIRTS